MIQGTTVQKLQVLASLAIAAGMWYALLRDHDDHDEEIPLARLYPLDKESVIAGEGTFFVAGYE